MCKAIGVADVEELLSVIPPSVRLTDPLDIEGGWDECSVNRAVRALAAMNRDCSEFISFAGAGCYDHYVPSFIDHILRKPEFFTAYTPYQPEVSQGTLQAIFEYQSAICRLTGMQVANASMYDGATALAEAALMTVRACRGRRTEILAASTLNPQWLEVLETYALSGIMTVDIVDPTLLVSSLTTKTAGVLVGYPSYRGERGDIAPVIDAVHAGGALAVVAASPMMLALWDNPGKLGADVVVGEAQCFGNPQSFGGPGLGYFAATEKLMRSMPGRIVGRTVDVDGKPGFVLTLSTREQHIRREKATSNICSNHALNALAAGAYLMYHGYEGLYAIASDCVAKAHRLHDALVATGLFEPVFAGEFGYEFALRYVGSGTVRELSDTLFGQGYLSGVIIADDELLLAVTEKRTIEEIDGFVEAVRHAATR